MLKCSFSLFLSIFNELLAPLSSKMTSMVFWDSIRQAREIKLFPAYTKCPLIPWVIFRVSTWLFKLISLTTIISEHYILGTGDICIMHKIWLYDTYTVIKMYKIILNNLELLKSSVKMRPGTIKRRKNINIKDCPKSNLQPEIPKHQ